MHVRIFLCLALIGLAACAADENAEEEEPEVQQDCAPGTSWCDGNWLLTCSPQGTVTSELPCPYGSCAYGECSGDCEAGKGSCAGTISKRCNAEGTGFIMADCAPGLCVDGDCGICFPSVRTCIDESTVGQCSKDGSTVEAVEDCNPKKTKSACFLGQCVSLCAVSLKQATNVGCEYWAADLDNYYAVTADGTVKDAQNAPFSVVLSNVNETIPAEVKVTTAEGTQESYAVGAGELKVLNLPSRNIDGGLLKPLAYRINSDIPIVAYQFNPLSNVDVFSNDASLLLPSGSLGMEYYVMAQEGAGGNSRAFLTVVGTVEGTQVSVTPTARTTKSEETGQLQAGQTGTYELGPYWVLNLESDGFGDDLTGTHIQANKPVAVFAGNELAAVPIVSRCVEGKCLEKGYPCVEDWECPAVCCGDHLEEQMLPVNALGTHYIGARSEPRNGEKDYWRVLATEDGTVVTTTPPIDPAPPKLKAGEHFTFATQDSVEIHVNKPVMVGQFLAGQDAPGSNMSRCLYPGTDDSFCQEYPFLSCEGHFDCPLYCSNQAECKALGLDQDAGIGDPSFILLVPTSRFRKNYVFLIPDKYARDYVSIALPVGADLVVDGVVVPGEQFDMIGTGEYRVARSQMSDGVHSISSNRPIGITVHGYDQYVSYGYPAGMAVDTLTGQH
jgi:hypothetical protein